MTTHRKPTQRALFEALVREHGGRLRLFLKAAARDPLVADELFQETLLVAWRRIDDFDPDRCFGRWLRGIGGRLLLARRRADARRGRSIDPAVLEQLEELCSTAPGAAHSRTDEELDALRDCLGRLNDDQRALIHQHYHEGRALRVIAETGGRTVEATKKVMQRLRARLFDCITAKLAGQGGLS
ncbi:MAG: sigma-70 family RNA polymerase sigma factor [Planctomycetota bacterium]